MASYLDGSFCSNVLFNLPPLSPEQFQTFQELLVLCIRPSLSLFGDCVWFPDLRRDEPKGRYGQLFVRARPLRTFGSPIPVPVSYLGVCVRRCDLFAL